MTISGSSLDGATGVSFGGVAAQSFTPAVQGITSEVMTATAPARAAGAVHVQVTGPGGVSLPTSADVYSYIAPVIPTPSIVVASPVNGASYRRGQPVTADYSCTAPGGVAVTACAGPVAKGSAIDTASLGSHTFTVNAKSSNGATASRSALYTVTVTGRPSVGMASPLIGGALATETPIIGDVSETAKTLRESNALAHISAKKKRPGVGTTFSFTLNERATVGFSFTRHAAARKVHGRCVAQTKKNRDKPRCTRTIAAGALTFPGHPGTNKVRFAGRISNTNKLRPGRYTLQITATDAQGKRSALGIWCSPRTQCHLLGTTRSRRGRA